MKRIVPYLLVSFVLLTFIPVQLKATTEKVPVTATDTKKVVTPEAKALIAKLEDFKKLDRSTMSPDEKKSMRNEVRTTKNRLHEIGGGVYISAGALIIILLVLIIVF